MPATVVWGKPEINLFLYTEQDSDSLSKAGKLPEVSVTPITPKKKSLLFETVEESVCNYVNSSKYFNKVPLK
jgi:hypothetical protein